MTTTRPYSAAMRGPVNEVSARRSVGSGIALTATRNASTTPTAVAGRRALAGAPSAPASAPAATARWNMRYSAALLWSSVPKGPPSLLTAGKEMS